MRVLQGRTAARLKLAKARRVTTTPEEMIGDNLPKELINANENMRKAMRSKAKQSNAKQFKAEEGKA